ncbi:ATP-binding protein [Laspinema olomoucense]|uniref:ATP-binding protein n=1 Tax=Laspinema olomoucense TaxID=3231600 RepID=UPI0021BB9AE6|nr:ATP-binding protein [Laspinema sp. D3c]MCT7994238.1 ATP-binding protein [Laspinema sp. D3c]
MIAEELGRLFEVGFNIGILAYLKHHKIKHHFKDLYRQDLQGLKLPKMVKRIAEKHEAIAPQNREILEKWSRFFIQKGFLSGLNFFGEYLNSPEGGDRLKRQLEILYYQCSFVGDNSIGTSTKDSKEHFTQVLSQFETLDSRQIQRIIYQYSGQGKGGEFLQSDTLMFLRYGQEFRILCVDLSVFSVQSAEDIVPLDDVEVLRQMLRGELGYLRSKSVFSKLRLDTGSSPGLDLDLSKDLRQYLTAFKRRDKESTKLIQAGSYAHSFYGFLQEYGLLPESASLVFNVVGYSDRHIGTISLRPDNLQLLATCAEIYKKEPKQQEIKTARKNVLKQIQRSAAKSFIEGQQLVDKLSSPQLSGPSITEVIHQERIQGFFNSVGIIPRELATPLGLPEGLTLRNGHAELIQKALTSQEIYLFLTGNPGIGKTTAIANFLQSHFEEGFLFLYVSPRKQVNLDIIDKFKSASAGNLCDDRLWCLTSNAVMIQENGGFPTVRYHTNSRRDTFTAKAVDFIPADQEVRSPRSQHQSSRLHQIAADHIRDRGTKTAGVLSSICAGIHTAVADQLSNQILATVSIQSLRVTTPGNTTLKHLNHIFKSAYNERDKEVIPAKMRQISNRIKHLFIMIDEITGDDSGVHFLQGISKFLHDYELTNPEHGFNTKVIVADASIVDKDVITQHLSQPSPEPDKIYFRLAKQSPNPLIIETFQFQHLRACAINTNSYPARELNITYKIFIESVKFTSNLFQSEKRTLVEKMQTRLAEDIYQLLNQPDSRQILVYIQDKKRLQELIETLRERRGEFEPYRDYLEIHASLSDAEKIRIQTYKQDVKVVFMTSSASRGLSFPKAQHILVEIPRFQIEQNLMEVIQVIYRARGEYEENGVRQTLDTEEKSLIFYLGDRAVYYPSTDPEFPTLDDETERQLSMQESILNLLNILLILKLSMMTRIFGSGPLGRKDCLIIPIGGKSVSTAGMTLSGQITHLIRELKTEYRQKPSHRILRDIFTSLEGLLSHAEFILMDETGTEETMQKSYLSLREEFNTQFPQYCNRLDQLLDLGNIEPGHLVGSLLIVPIHQRLEESYEIRLEKQIRRYATDDLINKMFAVSKSLEYPENLRSAIRGGAVELVELLRREATRTQWFEQYSNNPDQYYLMPLFNFIAKEAIAEYFKEEPQEEEDQEFRTLLSRYLHSLYPAYNTLPIGRKYREFPFLLFRSYSLEQMRAKMFSDKYLLNSHELNVLNLILSREGE